MTTESQQFDTDALYYDMTEGDDFLIEYEGDGIVFHYRMGGTDGPYSEDRFEEFLGDTVFEVGDVGAA